MKACSPAPAGAAGTASVVVVSPGLLGPSVAVGMSPRLVVRSAVGVSPGSSGPFGGGGHEPFGGGPVGGGPFGGGGHEPFGGGPFGGGGGGPFGGGEHGPFGGGGGPFGGGPFVAAACSVVAAKGRSAAAVTVALAAAVASVAGAASAGVVTSAVAVGAVTAEADITNRLPTAGCCSVSQTGWGAGGAQTLSADRA